MDEAVLPGSGNLPETHVEAAPQEQVTPPAPVESAGEVKPPEPKKIELSPREAIKRAMENYDKGEKTPEAKPAEKPAKATQEPAGPVRDEQGRFSAQTQDKPQQANSEPPKAIAQAPKVVSEPAPDVPARFSPDAKVAWNATPEPVRAEVKRALTELEAGIEKYRTADAELKPYHDMAKQYGTTVPQALARYTAFEKALHSDPMTALDDIFSTIKMSKQDYAAHVLGQEPNKVANQQETTIRELRGQLQQMQAQLGQFQTDAQIRQEQEIAVKIEQFKADKPRFAELEPIMARLIKSGVAEDLSDAYTMADRLNPGAPQQAQPQAIAPQPRKPNLSITGAPSKGSNPATQKPAKSIRDAIENARAIVG